MSEATPPRTRDAARTRAEILREAAHEFAERGFSGARVDEIARRTSTTKRMIYYYFGGKEQLYVAVLEDAYRTARASEQTLDTTGLEPVEALRQLAQRTYDHHTAHQDFVRLVAIENVHRATYLRRVTDAESLSLPALAVVDGLLAAGREQGTVRDGVDAVDVHMTISSYCVFPVANRHTFGYLFGRDLLNPARAEHYRTLLGDLVVALVAARDRPDGPGPQERR